jgi:hypothetical protein
MVLVVAAAILVAGIGVLGIASPARAAAFASGWQSRTGLWTASVVRLVVGVSLWFVAPASRTPLVLKILAVVSVASALVLPSLGLARFESILSWWSHRSPAFIRTWSAVAVVFGVFILWSVVP